MHGAVEEVQASMAGDHVLLHRPNAASDSLLYAAALSATKAVVRSASVRRETPYSCRPFAFCLRQSAEVSAQRRRTSPQAAFRLLRYCFVQSGRSRQAEHRLR